MTNKDSTGGTPPDLIEKGNWIGFKIIDEDTGKPIENVRVEIRDSEGRLRNKQTDIHGKVKFHNLSDGDCELVELMYDKRVMMKTKEKYTLKHGDSLEKIARRERDNGNNITAKDIAVNNWGPRSRDIRIMNENMRDEFGCTDYDGRTNHMIYKEDSEQSERR